MAAAYDKDIVLTVGLEPEGVVATAQELNTDLKKVFEKASGKQTSTAFKSLQISIDKTILKSQKLQDVITRLGAQPVPTSEFSTLNKQIDASNLKLAKLLERRKALTSKVGGMRSPAFAKVQDDIQKQIDALDKLKAARDALIASNKAITFGKDTELYRSLVGELNQVNNQMVVLKQRAKEINGIKLSGIIGRFVSLGSVILGAAKNVGIFLAKFTGAALSGAFNKLSGALKNIGTWAKKSADNLRNLVTRTIISNVKKLVSGITKLNKSGRNNNNIFKKGLKTFLRYGLGVRSLYALIRKLRRAIVKGFEELAQVDEPFNEAMSNLMTALKYLRNSFVTTFAPLVETVSPILTNFINQLAEATSKVGMLMASLTNKDFVGAIPVYQDYAESVSDAADSSESAAKKTKKQAKEAEKLKRTLAGFDDVEILKDNTDEEEPEKPAFTPTSILPSISEFASKLLDAWRMADFSEIGNILGDKILNALNKIPWDRIKNLLRKIAKSIATFLNGFLETPGLFSKIGETIAEAINSGLEFVESFISNFHWDSLGKAIKDLIIGLLDNIDFSLLYRTLSELGTGIGTALANTFDNPEIWNKIFTSLFKLLNSIINGLHSFLTSVDWWSIANYIATSLNDAIEEFDWMSLARTLSALINSVFDAWYNFIFTFDFFKFGKHIGETIAESIRNIDWDEGGAAVGRTITALFDTLNGAIQGINWEELGIAVKEFLTNAFANINWSTIYETASNLGKGLGTALETSLNDPKIISEILGVISKNINAVVYGITEFIQAIDWAQLGANIAIGLNNAVDTIDWGAIAKLLSVGFNAAFDLWYEAVAGFDFYNFGVHIGTTLSKAINNIDWKKGGASVAETINGLLEALNGFMETTDWESIGRGIIDILAGFFDTLDWGTVGTSVLNILKSLCSALNGAIDEVDWMELGNAIGKAIGDFFETCDLSEAATALAETFGKAFAAAVALIGGLGEAITNWIIAGVQSIGDFFGTEIDDAGGNVAQGILNGIGKVFLNVGTWITDNILTPFVNGILSVFGIHSPSKEMEPYGGNIGDGILEGIKSIFVDIANWIKTNIFDPFVAGIKSMFGLDGEQPALFSIGASIINGLLSGILSVAATIGTFIDENIVQPILGGFTSLNESINEIVGAEENAFGVASMSGATTVTEDYADALNYLNQVATESSDMQAWDTLRTTLEKLNEQGGLSDEALEGLTEQIWTFVDCGTPFEAVGDQMAATLEKADANVTTLNQLLGLTPDKTNDVIKSFDELATSSDDTSTKTGGIADVLDKFDGLSIATPLKLLLIKAAISNLGDSGELSDEQVANLQDTLDHYDTTDPSNSLSDLATEFEDTGISAESFATSLAKSTVDAKDQIGVDFKDIVDSIKDAGKDLKSEGTTAGNNLGDGLINGIEDKKTKINSTSTDLIEDDVLGAIDRASDSHSPSKQMYKRGQNLVQGMINGMTSLTSTTVSTASEITNKAMVTIESFADKFSNSGNILVSYFTTGLSTASYKTTSAIQSIIDSIIKAFYNTDWQSIGQNVGNGIFNGLQGMSDNLQTLARNTAISMYNAAKEALSIASPSKKFAWLGQMTMAGLGQGIEDNASMATSAVSNVVKDLENEANDINADIDLNTDMGDVLANFSDTVIAEFDKLIKNLQTLANFTVNSVPSIAQGKVVPYTSGLTNDKYETANEELLNELDYINAHQLSVDDLENLLEEVLRRHLNISFYIGDEQIARHANAGNLRLERRYSV